MGVPSSWFKGCLFSQTSRTVKNSHCRYCQYHRWLFVEIPLKTALRCSSFFFLSSPNKSRWDMRTVQRPLNKRQVIKSLLNSVNFPNVNWYCQTMHVLLFIRFQKLDSDLFSKLLKGQVNYTLAARCSSNG